MGNIEKYGVAALAVIILMIVVISILDLRDSGKLTGEEGTTENPAKVRIAQQPDGSDDPMLQKPVSVPNRWGESNDNTLEPKLLGGENQSYTVRSGDTLAKIAKRFYGEEQYHELIAQANPGINPRALQVGTTLVLPARSAKSSGGSSAGGSARTHVVKKNETLGEISQRYLGTWKRWQEIARLNGLKSDSDVKAGQKLKIPSQ